MKRFLAAAFGCLLSASAQAQTIDALGAGAAINAADFFPTFQTANPALHVTATQIKTFVSASPTLVTPTLGVAIGTSLALGGAAIGTNAFAATGTITASGLATFPGGITANGNSAFGNGGFFLGSGSTIQSWNAGSYAWSSTNNASGGADTFISRAAAASIQFGIADAAAPVAQTTRVQSVVAGTSNTAGAIWLHIGSLATGNALGGAMGFNVGLTGTTGTAQQSAFSLLKLNAGTATTATVQFGDGVNFTTYDSCTGLTTGATGVIACTASAARFKNILPDETITPRMASYGLDTLRVGAPVWEYSDDYKRFGEGFRVGLIADDVAAMDERCVTREDGLVKDYWDRCVIAYLVADRQLLKSRLSTLERRIHQ